MLTRQTSLDSILAEYLSHQEVEIDPSPLEEAVLAYINSLSSDVGTLPTSYPQNGSKAIKPI